VTPKTSRSFPAPAALWAYFFDVDGTLAEIERAPVDVRVDPVLRRRIEDLFVSSHGALAFISGRTIAEIDALFPHTAIPVAGQHGAERRDPQGVLVRDAVPVPRLDLLRARLDRAAREYPGLCFEDKGVSLAIHYRNAPGLAGFVHRLARTLSTECGPDIVVLRGKRVVELLPAGANKGRAVLAFLSEPPFRGRLPVFVGDDMSDEAAFAIVNRLGGCSVKVGRGPTAARWRLPNVTAVGAWLARSVAARPARRTSSGRVAP
jgi:trehalose 6-phosphate phosphatase